MRTHLPQVTLIGRVNAGKSTLFNKLSESTKALVSSIPGTTRDLNYARISWRGADFELVDTGGLDAGQFGAIEKFVQKKAYQAIAKSACLVFVADGQHELTAIDRAIAGYLKKTGQHIIFVLNKIDNNILRRGVSPDFYKLGLGEPVLVSALNGVGTGDLLDVIVKNISAKKVPLPQPELRIAIIGKTNVGKSSLLNAMLGEDHVIVTPIPHTTREPQDTLLNYKGQPMLIVDTAGLRKKNKIADPLERLSAQRTQAAIKQSDICLLVTDALQPLSNQDQQIAQLASASRHGIIIVVNKWDLVAEKTPTTLNKFIEHYQRYFPHLSWAPMIFVSAKEKQRVHKIIDLALDVWANRQQWLDPAKLNEVVQAMRQQKKVGRIERRAKGNYKLMQIDINPPRFDLVVGRHEDVHPAFINLLEKSMRDTFDLTGTPISITLQRKK